MTTQRVNANAVVALKEVLTAAFWFKSDLQRWAQAAVAGEPTFLSGIDWRGQQTKRESVDIFVNRLVGWQDKHPQLLRAVLIDAAAMDDFPDLAVHEDAAVLVPRARAAVERLRKFSRPYELELQADAANRARIAMERAQAQVGQSTSRSLAEIRQEFHGLLTSTDPQGRGRKLEEVLNRLFDLFDLLPRRAFSLAGEQIDGAFEFRGEHFLLEAKWEKSATPPADLDVFRSKVERRIENTMGLFVAIEGFSSEAVQMQTRTQSPLILFDGGDLYAVLEERITLSVLLHRKRREASASGNPFLPAAAILTGG